MSIVDFQAGIASKPNANHAIVSNILFNDLMGARMLDANVQLFYGPSGGKYAVVLDDLARSMGADPTKPGKFIYYTLAGHPTTIVVDRDIQFDMTLPATGPHSFKLLP